MAYTDSYKLLLAKARVILYNEMEYEYALETPSKDKDEEDWDIPYIAQQIIGEMIVET